MPSRPLISSCLKLASMFAMLLLATPSSAAEKNIVFFIADDMSPELGCYGNKAIKTPNIDALAADGTIFTNAYATTASCSASRSVVMTGLHNHANGQYGHQHDTGHFSCYPNVVSLALPQVMKAAGYRTGIFGKHHVAPTEIFTYDVMVAEKGRNTRELMENAREFITAKNDKPFIAYIASADPHRGGPELDIEGRPNAFGNKPNRGSIPGITEVFYDPKDVIVPHFLPDTIESRAELTQYYQSVSRVDFGIGHLVKLLKEAGLYDKTLIIITSDHGMAFPGGKTTVYEPGLKVPLIVRNPYVQRRGIKNDALVSHTDLTPTMLDFAGGLDREKNAPIKPVDADAFWKERGISKYENRGRRYSSYHGRSWLNILEQENDPTRTEIFASHTFHEVQMYYPMRVVRDQKYKLIWNIAHPLPFPFSTDLWAASTWQAQLKKGENAPYGQKTVGQYIHRPAFELYDMQYDADETKNLATDPAFAETLEEYKARLKKFQETMGDPWAQKWEYE
ncbi:sulfatase family protein [Verrucomicrobium spinosum]|uniref:sulfatase family protein n=2 Tax=Verrucomicrobium spinosum TaxID=2736 RepID=UPI0005C6F489|nr:sulfatase [Verrucomicrobium spinosum]